MPRFRYVGPLVGVDIPLLRLTDVKPGDEFDVAVEQAELLGAQPDNYEPVDKATAKLADRVQAEAARHFEDLVPKPAVDEPPAEEPGSETTAPALAGDHAQEG